MDYPKLAADYKWMKVAATIALPSMVITLVGMLLGFGLTFNVGMGGVLTGICIGIFVLIRGMWNE